MPGDINSIRGSQISEDPFSNDRVELKKAVDENKLSDEVAQKVFKLFDFYSSRENRGEVKLLKQMVGNSYLENFLSYRIGLVEKELQVEKPKITEKLEASQKEVTEENSFSYGELEVDLLVSIVPIQITPIDELRFSTDKMIRESPRKLAKPLPGGNEKDITIEFNHELIDSLKEKKELKKSDFQELKNFYNNPGLLGPTLSQQLLERLNKFIDKFTN